jgi:hypothetical protein
MTWQPELMFAEPETNRRPTQAGRILDIYAQGTASRPWRRWTPSGASAWPHAFTNCGGMGGRLRSAPWRRRAGSGWRSIGSIETMMAKHAAGSQANKKRAKEARDFDADFEAAKHISTEGWCGIPASAFRNAMISACRLVGFKMTLAKLSLFTEADGFDKVDLVPLIRITGDAEKHIMHARNATGVCDIRVRAKFWPWSADVRISYDADQFTATDVANLLQRVGQQVGIGEGRNDSKMSAGMGWGSFTLAAD